MILLGKTIPYTLPWDDMPIDLSFIYEKEKPAGKHGFLKVEGDRFVFEDGTEANSGEQISTVLKSFHRMSTVQRSQRDWQK